MIEIVGTFLGAKSWNERANSSVESWNSSRGNLAQELLEFAVRHFNWIEVRRVLWKIAKCRSSFLNRRPNSRTQMDTAVIHRHNVVASERRSQALFDICEEHLSVHGTLDHHWCGHLVVPQGGHERDRIPCSKRNSSDHSDAARSPSPQPHQICADRSLVDKHHPGGIKHPLFSYPTAARSRHVCALPFGSLQAFF